MYHQTAISYQPGSDPCDPICLSSPTIEVCSHHQELKAFRQFSDHMSDHSCFTDVNKLKCDVLLSARIGTIYVAVFKLTKRILFALADSLSL